jgi:hypothetical protein
MPAGKQTIWIVAGPEFKRVALALRDVESTMDARLGRALKGASLPLVEEAKTRVRTMRVRGHAGSTGLRARVARGVDSETTRSGATTTVRVTTSMNQPNEAIIPRGLDRPQGWRHPVFGNRDVWVTQRGSGSWFTDTFQDGRVPIQDALTDVLEDARDTVARSG